MLGLQALGVFAMALAGAVARAGHSSLGETALWLGVLAIVGPTPARLVSAASTRALRIVLVPGLGVAAYLTKVVIWPVQFTYHDEFVHWRTAANILRTHHLFTTNPLTPVSACYPGSEIMTAAWVQLCLALATPTCVTATTHSGPIFCPRSTSAATGSRSRRY